MCMRVHAHACLCVRVHKHPGFLSSAGTHHAPSHLGLFPGSFLPLAAFLLLSGSLLCASCSSSDRSMTSCQSLVVTTPAGTPGTHLAEEGPEA